MAAGGGVPAHAHRRRARPSTRPPGSSSSGYAATDEQFPTIAKLRAARRLWARVLELSGGRRDRAERAARRHQPADDEQVRPLGQHAAHHRRRLRRRRRRRRRGHGAARSTARSARPTRFGRRIARNTSLAADLRVARRPGRRPRRRLVRRREAHRRPRRRRLGASSAGSRPTGARRSSARIADGRRRARRGRSPRREAAADRAHRVPEPRRGRCPSAAGPHGDRRCAATARPSRRCATTRPRRRSSWPPWARSPRTPPARPSPPTCSPPAASPSTSAGPTDGVDDLLAAYDGQPVVCLAGTDAAYAEWGADLVAALREAGATSRDRRRQGRSTAPTTRARWASTRWTFLRRTREKLA